ncbi:MAG TPA: maleylpyruvate isomerase family mycothiol-dependent enzyme [Mycobacterium sp.]
MDYAAALFDENRAFGELVRAGDPATSIPTCPEWNLRQLFRHVGRGHRWAAQMIADRVDHPLDPRAVEGGKPPDDPGEAITWLNDGAQRLVDAVAQVGPDTPVWTFLGPRPASWWIRRRLHEVTVHRADAALALGRSYQLAPELAADAISEWLDVTTQRAGRDTGAAPLNDGQTIHLHATDPGLGPVGEWTVRADATGLTWSHEHGKGSVALRGPALDLLLAITSRVPVADTGVAVFGDGAVWQNWLDHTAF